MIAIVADGLGVSFWKCGKLLYEGFKRLGYKSVYLLNAHTSLIPKVYRCVLIGDTIFSVKWGWHERHKTDKCIFWTDTPLSLDEIRRFTGEVNKDWCIAVTSYYQEKVFRNAGFKVSAIIPRPIDVYTSEKIQGIKSTWRERFGRYVITVGGDQTIIPSRKPRKGLEMFDRLAEYVKAKYGLNAVAVSNWTYFRHVYRIPLGSLREEDLLTLIRDAELFVWPSRCEGFGVPPLEAMSVGQVVVCSNAPFNGHVVGIKFDYTNEELVYMPEINRFYPAFDYDFEQLREAVDYALSLSNDEREEIREKAREVASYYRPDLIAQLLMEV